MPMPTLSSGLQMCRSGGQSGMQPQLLARVSIPAQLLLTLLEGME